MTSPTPTPTMTDLYPGDDAFDRYHQAHEAYMRAVNDALTAAGIPTTGWHAEANDPRDGFVALDVTAGMPDVCTRIWDHTEVAVCWQEERGWTLLAVDRFDEPQWTGKGGWQTDSRQVYDLGLPTIASPVTVARAVAEAAGLTLDLDDDSHPDADFPGHEQDDEDVAFELALRRYAKGQP